MCVGRCLNSGQSNFDATISQASGFSSSRVDLISLWVLLCRE